MIAFSLVRVSTECSGQKESPHHTWGDCVARRDTNQFAITVPNVCLDPPWLSCHLYRKCRAKSIKTKCKETDGSSFQGAWKTSRLGAQEKDQWSPSFSPFFSSFLPSFSFVPSESTCWEKLLCACYLLGKANPLEERYFHLVRIYSLDWRTLRR